MTDYHLNAIASAGLSSPRNQTHLGTEGSLQYALAGVVFFFSFSSFLQGCPSISPCILLCHSSPFLPLPPNMPSPFQFSFFHRDPVGQQHLVVIVNPAPDQSGTKSHS